MMMAIAMNATIPPITTMISGSSRLVSAVTRVSTSASYERLTFCNICSSWPLFSPTAIMCVTIGGKYPLRRSGSASSINGLRALWRGVVKSHKTHLDGLRPLIAVRERRQSGIRRTRAVLLDVRQAVDAYLADHQGRCPENFAALDDYGPREGTPRDGWGRPLTLICDGSSPGEPYRLISAGPDGIAGGLDRIE